MFSIEKRYFLLLILLVCAACTGPAQRVTPDDMGITRPGARAVVVVHSRSGNTARMGMLISEMMNADYVRLDVPRGSGDSFLSSPNRHSGVSVVPGKIDLAKYRLVFLGSPIWYWHPTAFIYSFIRNNELAGKKVVLFYTYQGGIAKDAAGEWREMVKKRGGEVIDVVGVNRKIHDTDAALLAEVAAAVTKRKTAWDDGNKSIPGK